MKYFTIDRKTGQIIRVARNVGLFMDVFYQDYHAAEAVFYIGLPINLRIIEA